MVIAILSAHAALAGTGDAARRVRLPVTQGDVIPTGNEWVALPTIRAAVGALMSFNALSMRDRGLLQVNGEGGNPARFSPTS